MQSKIIGSSDRKVFWSKNDNCESNLFVNMIQLYSGMAAIMLEANGIITYKAHVMLRNFTKQFRRYVINHGHTRAGLHQVSVLENTFDQDEACKFVNVWMPSSLSVVLSAISFS